MVPSDAESSAYRVAAENVPGVRKVKNHMRRVPAAVGMGI
jgi:osmotically-inducible protein OsmY